MGFASSMAMPSVYQKSALAAAQKIQTTGSQVLRFHNLTSGTRVVLSAFLYKEIPSFQFHQYSLPCLVAGAL